MAVEESGSVGPPTLPPMTVARFDEVARMLDRLVSEHADVFAAGAERYAKARRERSSRPLAPLEAAQVASGLASQRPEQDIVEMTERVQASTLYAQDDPAPVEVLVAAGIATAPAALEAGLGFVALVELPAVEFREAREAGTLPAAIAAHVRAHLDDLELADARARAGRALEHFGAAAGATAAGGTIALLFRAALAIIDQGMQERAHLIADAWESSTLSPERTDGLAATASTTSDR